MIIPPLARKEVKSSEHMHTYMQRSQLPQPKPVAQPNPSQLGNIFLLAIGVVGLVACDFLPAPESRLTTSI